MAKGATAPKKTQLRRCALCQKAGHNKSTCSEMVSQINTDLRHGGASKTVRSPLKFFVHHVNFNSHQSPHLINLKEHKNNQYEDIQAVAPKENKDFYFNHDARGPSFSPKQVKSPAPQKIATPKASTAPVIKLPGLKQKIEVFINSASSLVAPKHLVTATLLIFRLENF